METLLASIVPIGTLTCPLAAAAPPEFKWREVEIGTVEISYGLQLADVDGDGKPDIVAAARQTKNLKIFFNKS